MARLPTTFYVYGARSLRDFGDGFTAVLLPVNLTALGLGPFEIDVVATATLLGSALTTLAVGFLGTRADQRLLLLLGSGQIVVTGLAFAASSSYAVVLLVALIGTINPSAGSVSIFVPLEHGAVAFGQRRRAHQNVRALRSGRCISSRAWGAGFSPDLMASLGLSRLTALPAMFVFYAGLGAAAAVLYGRSQLIGAWSPRPPHRPWDHRAGSSTGWRLCSASTRLPAGLLCNR